MQETDDGLTRGWLPTTGSVVLVYPGHVPDLLPDQDVVSEILRDSATRAEAPQSASGRYESKVQYEAPNLFAAILEWVQDPVEPRSRLQIQHKIFTAAEASEMARVVREFSRRVKLKPISIGINIARVYVDGERFDTKRMFQELAGGTTGHILGGRRPRVQEITVRSEKASGEVQLKIRSAFGQTPIVGGRFEALHADVNYTSPGGPPTAVRAVTSQAALERCFLDFGRMMRRLEKGLTRD